MSHAVSNPRSALHAQCPFACGTPDVESLLGYFCRLSVSHSVSVPSLANIVIKEMGSSLREGFDWHERNLSGSGEAAQTWASALSALTGVPRLDQLTMVPWCDVVASKALAATRGRWCPECLAEDRERGSVPYFRLIWDVGAVTVCHRHWTSLVHLCPDCGRSGARHRANYVVPGWCVHCGAFLGASCPADSARRVESAEAAWIARQVAQLLSIQDGLMSEPRRGALQGTIQELITRLDNGKSAAFARRIGVGKATVHNWMKGGGIPTLEASLRMALHSGLPLPRLLTGELEGWKVPHDVLQLDLDLPFGKPTRDTPRDLDWDALRRDLSSLAALPVPISLAEAGRRLGVDVRHLYLRANKESRLLSERWKLHKQRCGEETRAKARLQIKAACSSLLADGRALNLREIAEHVPLDVLGSVEHVFDVLREIKEELGVT